MYTPTLNPDGYSVKGCTIIYAPRGQAGEYSRLATNPYRGCGHQCAYCVDGDTLVQMADGSAKPIRNIKTGDSIIGVVINGNARAWNTRFATTTVLAKIKSEKTAYRVTLADGTEVICSADHRWLTERGWKYTTATGQQRPALTLNNSIRKVGAAVATPPVTRAYQAGYIAGMVEGDANLAVYDYSDRRRPSGKTMGVQHRFRLALKDTDALARTKSYLIAYGIDTTDFTFLHAGGELAAIGTTSPERYARIEALLAPQDDPEWLRGWLAGIFDAEGSHGADALRICNTDERILSLTTKALQAFGFSVARDTTAGKRADSIRVRGGRSEELRFWQLTDPAIKRKFTLENQAVSDSVRISRIKPLNEVREMFDIMTGTETFVANGLVSHNCYVPQVLKMPRAEFDAGAVERPGFLGKLERDAAKYAALGVSEQVMLSFTTDPYHPGDTSLTRATLEVLADYDLPFCTLTKGGNRAVRDIDLFDKKTCAFATTLTTLDDAFSRKWERGATLPKERIDTLWHFRSAGIFTWVSLEPTLDVASSLAIIEHTHEFVDLYKIGRANYLPMTTATDWQDYTLRVLETANRLGARHYIKKDLQPFLPVGYVNPEHIAQHHGPGWAA